MILIIKFRWLAWFTKPCCSLTTKKKKKNQLLWSHEQRWLTSNSFLWWDPALAAQLRWMGMLIDSSLQVLQSCLVESYTLCLANELALHTSFSFQSVRTRLRMHTYCQRKVSARSFTAKAMGRFNGMSWDFSNECSSILQLPRLQSFEVRTRVRFGWFKVKTQDWICVDGRNMKWEIQNWFSNSDHYLHLL